MAEPTQPLSIRLATSDIDHLAERARRISGTPTGVARELIRAGLTDGDPFTQAERLLKIERRLAAIAQDVQAVLTTTTAQTEAATRVETMFEDLLRALSGQPLK
jgi:DNA-binding ferritin-like protein